MAVSRDVTAGEAGAGADRVRDLIARAQAARGDAQLEQAVSAYREFAEAEPFWR
jgi:hypothetical protein